MPKRFSDFDEAISSVANKNGCKYLFCDGLTAVHALTGNYSRQLVQVGQRVNPGRQGFIASLDWNENYTHAINNATLMLSETIKIQSLEGFLEHNTSKNWDTDSHLSVRWSTLQLFFFCAFGVSAIIFLHNIGNPEKRTDESSERRTENVVEDDLENVLQ